MNSAFLIKFKVSSILLFLFALSFYSSLQAESLLSKKALTASPDSQKLEWVSCPEFLPCQFAVLHGELGGNNMDIFLKFPSGAKVPFHTHSSAEHMIMIAGEFHTTYEGQEKSILKAGNYAYGPTKLAHDGYCASKEECIMFVAYETPLDAVPYSRNSVSQ